MSARSTAAERAAAARFRRALLAWFRENRRDLPWRRDRSAYKTWISEIMLQQTVVAAVAPRFTAWLARYPDPGSVARANEAEIVRAWEGLGYYSRARNLHAAARLIVARHAGKLPATYPGLRGLPGIGDYTASAILSIAHGLPLPVIDANVKRVAQRLLAIPTWSASVERRVRSFLELRIDTNAPGDFNEAMMELGAIVCLPAAPDCAHCPVATACKARARGSARRIPRRIGRSARAFESRIVVATSRDLAWIVPASRVDRSGTAATGAAATGATAGPGRLFEGLWAFPRAESVRGAIPPPPPGAPALPPVTHAYLTIRERLVPVRAEFARTRSLSSDGRWVTWDELERVAMPSAYRRIARTALSRAAAPRPDAAP